MGWFTALLECASRPLPSAHILSLSPSAHVRLIAGHARLTTIHHPQPPPTTQPPGTTVTCVCTVHAVFFQPRTRKVRTPIGARGVKESTKIYAYYSSTVVYRQNVLASQEALESKMI
ncbi:unnamed protein product [Ectocarpus fasciculatus]